MKDSPQDRLDVRQKHVGVERLGNVIVGAQFESQDLLQLTAACGDEDDRRGVRLLAEMPERIQAIHAGQPDVEEHQVRWIAAGESERVLHAGRSGHPVTGTLQAESHAAAEQGIIIHQQDVVR